MSPVFTSSQITEIDLCNVKYKACCAIGELNVLDPKLQLVVQMYQRPL